MFEVKIKNGTSGHFSEDGCNLLVREIPSNNIPNTHDVIEITTDDFGYPEKYLVTEVERSYCFIKGKFSEFIAVYVLRL